MHLANRLMVFVCCIEKDQDKDTDWGLVEIALHRILSFSSRSFIPGTNYIKPMLVSKGFEPYEIK